MATSRASSRRRRKFRTAIFRSRSICAMSNETGKKADSRLDSPAPMNETSVEPEEISAPPPVKNPRGAQVFDESVWADGSVRPHYAKFFDSLEQIGAGELERRWENGRRLVQEQGITYNVYGDERGMERPWELDPVPFADRGERMAHTGSRPDSARQTHQPHSRRLLRPAASDSFRRPAAGAGVWPAGFFAAVPRHPAEGRENF